MLTLLDVLNKTTAFFKQRGLDKAQLEAQLVLAHVLQTDRLQLFMRFDQPMTETELAALREPVARRGRGEPLAYITGVKEFWSLEFHVGPGVLIPRPDTETLVEQVLAELGDAEFLADIGAGTGCIGIALASESPALRVFSVERSRDALPLLKQNVARHALQDRVAVLGGDLLAPIPAGRPIDWIVSNPPYIPTGDLPDLEVSAWEPAGALDGGADGLDVYRRLIPEAARRARQGVAVEIGWDQGPAVCALFEAAGLTPRIAKDLAGHDRVVIARTAKAPPG